jgi:hypothetical protein
MQYLYKQFLLIIPMTEKVWKCFRCNLTFKSQELADMHKEISHHSITRVKAIVA